MKGSTKPVVGIKVAAAKPAKPLIPFFSAVGYVNVDFTHTSPTQRMYDYFSSFHNHFQYIRMHNTLTAHGQADRFLLAGGRDFGNPGDMKPEKDDRIVTLGEGGKLRFDWTVLDQAYDRIVAEGMRIIVETDFLPSCLRRSEQLWYIPEDYTLWEQTIRSFIGHLEARYGSREIEQWFFEIWNEPDIFPAWRDDPQSFFALYDYMERAVHSVNPRLKVGGPATTQLEAGIRLFRAFLQHCSSGVNYAGGGTGTRVDFLSVHCKAGSLEDTNPSTERIFVSIEEYRRELAEFPGFAHLEFFNDESGIVWGGNRGTEDHSWLNFRNTHYAAGFICKLVDQYCRRVQDHVNLRIMDIDNCQLQWEKSLFSGHRSLLTPLFDYPSTDLIRKSAFNAYVLLSRLGNERLQVSCGDPDFGRKFGCLATRRRRSLALMIWNFEDGIEDGVNSRSFVVRVDGHTEPGRYKLIHYRIDNDHSNAYRVWSELGKPRQPEAAQIKAMRDRENLELAAPVRDIEMNDSFPIAVELPMHGISLLQLVPENKKAPKPPAWIKGGCETGAWGRPQIFLKWTASREADFLHYRLQRKRPEEKEYRVLCESSSLNTSVYIDAEPPGDGACSYRVQAVNASGVVSQYSEDLVVSLNLGERE